MAIEIFSSKKENYNYIQNFLKHSLLSLGSCKSLFQNSELKLSKSIETLLEKIMSSRVEYSFYFSKINFSAKNLTISIEDS